MPDEPISFDDDGLVPVTYNGKKIDLDIYGVYLDLAAMDDAVREEMSAESNTKQEIEYLNRLIAYMEKLGYPAPITKRGAGIFDRVIEKVVNELGKAPAVAPTPD